MQEACAARVLQQSFVGVGINYDKARYYFVPVCVFIPMILMHVSQQYVVDRFYSLLLFAFSVCTHVFFVFV